MGRFSAAIVAFATGTAFVASGRALPEFFIQLRDPNLLGGTGYTWLLHTFGFSVVASLCAVTAAAALLLAAWRTRLRGASDWHVGLAATLIALCLMGRLGVSLDPIAWLCAAAICLLLDRDDLWSAAAIVVIVAFWSLTQGGATAGALIIALSAAGYLIDKRRLDAAAFTRLITSALAIAVSLVQVHSGAFSMYGAHALYLDSLLGGAQRDRLWAGAFTPQNLGFAAIVVLAGWYGIRRRERAGDALTFFAMLILSLADARNLPLFGIVAGPVVADALASYYLAKRERPRGSLSAYGVAFAAAACAFVAAVTVMQPKIVAWPRPANTTLLSALLARPGPHHVLCVQPRWCDAAAFLRSGKLSVVLDDRAGAAAPVARKIQRDVADAIGNWQEDLRRANIDGILADQDNRLVSLLHADGWQSTISSGGTILLQKFSKQ
ncbi:MAG TPA: hypothetical protein VGR69_09225 [Candidatus Rubrimentiphilum sp.]|nr:hypothetical protein [Candidatus Rubrimentiphilum sp.]